MNPPPSWSGLFTRLIALSSFGIAAPLFALADMHPDYFTTYHCDAVDVGLVTGFVWLAPPVALCVLARLAGARAGRVLSLGATWALTVALITAVAALADAPVFPGRTMVAAAVAALATPALLRYPSGTYSFATLLGAALLVPAHFLTLSTVAVTFFGGAAARRDSPVIGKPAPVVLVIFDELPLPSLLTAQGEIDAALFPGFARMARRSTWYRNATTVDPYTFAAVPAMLTGNMAIPFEPPSSAVYPDNLFTLFGGRDVEAFEYDTRMLPVGQGTRDRYASSRLDRLAAIVHDARLVLPLIVSGEAQSGARLAAVSQQFQMFTGQRFFFGRMPAPTEYFDQFVASVPRWRPDGLYFFHNLLPHPPWFLLPDGTYYESSATAGYDVSVSPVPSFPGKSIQEMRWTPDPFLVDQGYQRHLLQLMHADRQLARLLDALDASPLKDQAMVIVTSDHGAYYGPGRKVRGYVPLADRDSSVPFLYSIPLFIKYPGQAKGEVSEANVEHIDLLPTIAAVLEIQVPWAVAGRSMLVPLPEKPAKSATTELAASIQLPAHIGGAGAASASRRAWFEPDPRDPKAWPYRPRPFGHLVGTPAPAPQAALPDVTLVLDDHTAPRPPWAQPGTGGYLKGCASGPGVARAPLWLACALKGKLIAFTRVAFPKRDSSPFLALFPEAIDGRDPALEVFVVTSAPGAPLTLARPASSTRGSLAACYTLPH